MNMRDVVEACRSIGVDPDAGPLGVRLGSTGWRVESGGGIAGNGGVWWLQPIAGMFNPKAPDATAKPIGPLRTRAQLRRAILNKWKNQKLRIPTPTAEAAKEPT